MKILICQYSLYIPNTHSLKEKRGVLKSLQSKIHKKFNASIAEIDHNDVWQSSMIGISMVGTSVPLLQNAIQQITLFIETDFPNITILNEEIEII